MRHGSRVRISLLDIVDSLAWITLGGLAIKFARTFEIETLLRKAGLLIHPHIYAARALFFTFITFIISILALSLVMLFIESLPICIAMVVMTCSMPLIVLGAFMAYPSIKAAARVKSVDHELPFFAAYLTTMAYSGVPPEKVIEMVSELKLFRGIREEAQRILRDIKLFGRDPLTAIESVALTHPSMLFRELMLGYTTTIRTGGDVIHYLESRTQDLFRRRIEDIRLLSERIGMIVEAFIAINVIMVLGLYVLFIVSTLLPFTTLKGVNFLPIFILIVQPLISIFMLCLVDSILPKDPVWDKSVFAYLFLTFPPAIVLGIIIFNILGGYEVLMGRPLMLKHVYAFLLSLSIALIVASIGGVKGYIKKRKFERNIGTHLANFLRDLTEVRKTGLSIERCIIYLSQRKYGALTEIIKRVAGALVTGMDLKLAVRRAVQGVRNWLVLIVLKFLIDAVEYGGATPQILDALSRFTNEISVIWEELKRRLRPYVAIPYFGAAIIAFTSLIVLGMLVRAIQSVISTSGSALGTVMGLSTVVSTTNVISILIVSSVGAIINAWLMGLMSGKLQNLSILSGFIHAILLTLISLIVNIVGIHIFIAPVIS